MRELRQILIVLFWAASFVFQVAAQPLIPGEDIPNASDDLRDLLYERHEVQEEIAELEKEKKRATKRLELLNDLVKSQKQSETLVENIDQALKDGDKKKAEELEKELHAIEHRMDFKRAVSGIDSQIQEFEPMLKFLKEFAEEEPEAKEVWELVNTTIGALKETRAVHERMLELHLKDAKGEARSLEKQLRELERFVRVRARMIELIKGLYEAEEEGDEELIEELEEQIGELEREFEEPEEEAEEDEDSEDEEREKKRRKKAAKQPVLPPIEVNDQKLAQFANVNFDKEIVPLLKSYCYECHNNETSSGELNIESLITERPIVKNREKWINILEQTKNRVMPTEDGTQPEEAHREKLVLALHHSIHSFDYSNVKNPGFELTRRLTHSEYDNTIRDLMGIDIRPASEFPTDLVGTSGFDNSANTLFVQPLLMERYMGAAELVVSTAIVKEPQTQQQRQAHKLLFIDQPKDASDQTRAAKAVLTHFLKRAYRRPAGDREIARAMKQFSTARSNGLDFYASIRATVLTTLVSPNFLLKNESLQSTEGDYLINDWELASRLSYFLWGSMPDEELFELAAANQLSDPNVLKEQVKRMISDDRSSTLGSTFAAQWLGSQHLGTRMRLDPIDNPWCTETLMAAMRNETSMFFHSLVLENAPIERLINADYTFLNEELAKLYRIRGISGDEMQRVKLKASDRRGGIFGQGSLLAVTSFPGRTSPVVRGRWILGDVLGTPPPPPPPNVSELPEEIERNDRLTFRQKLEVHRTSPNCYACHSQMDPLGFALENYDWFGRLRGRGRRSRKVDVTGQLPNGTQFEGLDGLKKVVVEQRLDDLVRQVSSKMLSYGLGRQLEYFDEPALRKIVASVKADNNRFHTLIQEIVTSYPFQYKRVPEKKTNSLSAR